jgi:hypothetical protein
MLVKIGFNSRDVRRYKYREAWRRRVDVDAMRLGTPQRDESGSNPGVWLHLPFIDRQAHARHMTGVLSRIALVAVSRELLSAASDHKMCQWLGTY